MVAEGKNTRNTRKLATREISGARKMRQKCKAILGKGRKNTKGEGNLWQKENCGGGKMWEETESWKGKKTCLRTIRGKTAWGEVCVSEGESGCVRGKEWEGEGKKRINWAVFVARSRGRRERYMEGERTIVRGAEVTIVWGAGDGHEKGQCTKKKRKRKMTHTEVKSKEEEEKRKGKIPTQRQE